MSIRKSQRISIIKDLEAIEKSILGQKQEVEAAQGLKGARSFRAKLVEIAQRKDSQSIPSFDCQHTEYSQSSYDRKQRPIFNIEKEAVYGSHRHNSLITDFFKQNKRTCAPVNSNLSFKAIMGDDESSMQTSFLHSGNDSSQITVDASEPPSFNQQSMCSLKGQFQKAGMLGKRPRHIDLSNLKLFTQVSESEDSQASNHNSPDSSRRLRKFLEEASISPRRNRKSQFVSNEDYNLLSDDCCSNLSVQGSNQESCMSFFDLGEHRDSAQ
ncbi:hypothetical protein FGO68_gene5970 [Halteria grandinella]|uniref:Uncharacterized protein n=1 Tax=Halteria grandinella TaxID=5974 RepID=A0A8J8NJZ2_HALGN|nr:hypothetical protein FGO68_gene5970 [Halteria grandinella]